MIKLAIFDLDGTLIDTMEDIVSACNHALKDCGCPQRQLEEYNMLIGRGIFNLFRGALPEDRRSEEMVEKMHGSFVPYYNEHICDHTAPYPGIYGMLDRLTEAGISLAVASNKYQEATEVNTWKNGVKRALKQYIEDGTRSKGKCPQCGQENMAYQNGCLTCMSCGYSKCG